jgi:hypothetical protein
VQRRRRSSLKPDCKHKNQSTAIVVARAVVAVDQVVAVEAVVAAEVQVEASAPVQALAPAPVQAEALVAAVVAVAAAAEAEAGAPAVLAPQSAPLIVPPTEGQFPTGTKRPSSPLLPRHCGAHILNANQPFTTPIYGANQPHSCRH